MFNKKAKKENFNLTFFNVFKLIANIEPNKLSKKGIHLLKIIINSDSNKKKLLKNINIELFQEFEPKPINKSLIKNPINMLKKIKIRRGNNIKVLGSWINCNETLLELLLFINVKKNQPKRIESCKKNR